MRDQLVLRTRGVLETLAVTARSSLKKEPTRPINPETMNGVLIAWARYDRVSDNLWLLGNPSLQDRIEVVVDFGRMTAEKIMEDERRFRETRDKLGQVTPQGYVVHPSILEGAIEQRRKLHGLLEKLRDSAQTLLDDFNAQWPPVRGHSERQEPETSGIELPPVIAETARED